MEDPIQNYRVPTVTATGIFLGFVFNALASWASRSAPSSMFYEVVAAIGLCTCSVLLLVVLYRILNFHYPKEKAGQYFDRTLRLLISGLSIAFLAFILMKADSILQHRASSESVKISQ